MLDKRDVSSYPLGMPPRVWWRIVVMILTIVLGISMILTILKNLQKAQKISSQPPIPVGTLVSSITPLPFQENPAILQTETDDAYPKTEGFYYLIHQMMVTSEEEIQRKMLPSLGWKNLKDLAQREKLRGQIFSIRGSLVSLRSHTLEGDLAKKRGLEGAVVWEGAIANASRHFFWFIVTENPKIVIDSEVELVGAFLKVWVYENRQGRKANAPLFIGKTLRLRHYEIPKGPRHLVWALGIFLGAFALLLLVGILWSSKKSELRPKKTTPAL